MDVSLIIAIVIAVLTVVNVCLFAAISATRDKCKEYERKCRGECDFCEREAMICEQHKNDCARHSGILKKLLEKKKKKKKKKGKEINTDDGFTSSAGTGMLRVETVIWQ